LAAAGDILIGDAGTITPDRRRRDASDCSKGDNDYRCLHRIPVGHRHIIDFLPRRDGIVLMNTAFHVIEPLLAQSAFRKAQQGSSAQLVTWLQPTVFIHDRHCCDSAMGGRAADDDAPRYRILAPLAPGGV